MLHLKLRDRRRGRSASMARSSPMAPIGMAVYYLAWKHLVGRLNQELAIG